jgi:hypothetical protein
MIANEPTSVALRIGTSAATAFSSSAIESNLMHACGYAGLIHNTHICAGE